MARDLLFHQGGTYHLDQMSAHEVLDLLGDLAEDGAELVGERDMERSIGGDYVEEFDAAIRDVAYKVERCERALTTKRRERLDIFQLSF